MNNSGLSTVKTLLGMSVMTLFSSCAYFSDSDGIDIDRLDADHAEHHHYLNVPKMTWGENQTVSQYQQYSFSGTPNKNTLLYAKAAGVHAVVDLRQPSSKTAQESSDAKSVGLEYTNLPSPEDDQFSQDFLDQFAALLGTDEEKVFLIHHETQNLAAAWFAAYVADRSNLNTDTAIGIAQSIGLSIDSTEKNLRNFLDSPPEIPVDETNVIGNTADNTYSPSPDSNVTE